jgi:chorismate dehydratase
MQLIHWHVQPSLIRKLRIAAIQYLNPAPLMWDFEHDPERERLAKYYTIHPMLPAQCADALAAGHADIGLTPATIYATVPGLSIIPGCVIASRNAVRSILLVMRSGLDIGKLRRVALDPASRSSNAYAQIILQRFHGAKPEYVLRPGPRDSDPAAAVDVEKLLRDCDAAVLIGDPALRLIEGLDAIHLVGATRPHCIDLALEWRQYTGLPWVSAFWAVRSEAIAASGRNASDIASDFERSRDHGLEHLEEITAEWAPHLANPPAVLPTMIEAYLRQNIHYVLDDACRAGLECFYRYAAEMKILPEAPRLHFL